MLDHSVNAPRFSASRESGQNQSLSLVAFFYGNRFFLRKMGHFDISEDSCNTEISIFMTKYGNTDFPYIWEKENGDFHISGSLMCQNVPFSVKRNDFRQKRH
jgi:hypothetical protein